MPVDFAQWVAESRARLGESGRRGALKTLYYGYVGALLHAANCVPLGRNVLDAEWDLLIVLDACRVDALRAVSDEYDFLGPVGSVRSVGSTSFEWLALTFDRSRRQTVRRTAYVTGNPYPELVFDRKQVPPYETAVPFGPRDYDVVDSEDFLYLDEVAEYGVDPDQGAVPARTITDRTIAAGRTHDPDRLIAHYMQPHTPYLGAPPGSRPAFADLMSGDVSRSAMWDAYLATLRYVLDDVELLLENVDAETVVITADHGEAFGEWGFYGHTIGCPHPVVRRVPWVETTATDDRTYEPTVVSEVDDTFDRDQHLQDLGYL
ncbi:alkaline phosphatase family protein [Haloarcula laminariae]|uniref:sulfatase-like hydrolase/transferase n=1 Tax=Haloarcula laminariae TaxID=2961577 RepID=UPI0024062E70|nr:sulfatase-like hydrolase/transferase [Halomicroarcula sp. FL173]